MSNTTPNIGLTLVSSTEGTFLISDWIDLLTGNLTTDESNMQIIDREVGAAKTNIAGHTSNLQVHVTSNDKSVWNNKNELIRGYYSGGSFYEDADHSQTITPKETALYVDLLKNTLYVWNTSTSQYDPVASGGETDSDYGTWG